jgi:hypothetical protein
MTQSRIKLDKRDNFNNNTNSINSNYSNNIIKNNNSNINIGNKINKDNNSLSSSGKTDTNKDEETKKLVEGKDGRPKCETNSNEIMI